LIPEHAGEGRRGPEAPGRAADELADALRLHPRTDEREATRRVELVQARAALVGREGLDRAGRTGAERAQRETWRSFAEQGQYDRAYALLGEGGVVVASRGVSPDSLLALADVARHSGHPAEAISPLETLLREHSSDGAAPLAAYTLGRVFVTLGRHEDAGRAFERALSLGAPRAIEEDLRWLLVRSRRASGDAAGAARAAEEYRARFRDGRHARALDALLGAAP
jgi:tetratricopeptide (TPR) repeat protein